MSQSSPLDTLFIPFQTGRLSWADKTLFMGAQYHPDLQQAALWQFFKPFADELTAHGFSPSEKIPDQKFDLVLCAIPKQVDESKFWIANAIERLNDKGILVAAAANDAGGSRLEKWFEEAGLTALQSESKNKARVVWGMKTKAAGTAWLEQGAVCSHDFGDGLHLKTQPGLFSWDRIDFASRLLVENFPPSLSGHIADFGCGYGYLSVMAIKNNPKVTKVTLVEADARALSCALENLTGHDVVPLWHDATKPLQSGGPFDYILMNPPFHTGKKTDISLGQSFIVNAAAQLKKGGSLTLVANTHLPYEAVLEKALKNVKLVVQKNGFKILRAVK